MRIDFRKSVFWSISLVTSGTLLTSDLMAAPADASVRHPGHGRSIDRQAIQQQVARQQQASRSAVRQKQAARSLALRQRTSRSAAAQRVAPAPTPKPKIAAAPRPGEDQLWRLLRNCEAGGRYDRNSGNGYYGAYQMSAGTWRGLGYKGLPHQAPSEVQDEAARKLQTRSGWGQWPACSRRIGAR